MEGGALPVVLALHLHLGESFMSDKWIVKRIRVEYRAVKDEREALSALFQYL